MDSSILTPHKFLILAKEAPLSSHGRIRKMEVQGYAQLREFEASPGYMKLYLKTNTFLYLFIFNLETDFTTQF